MSGKSPASCRPSRARRGAYRDRHGRWARDAVDACGAQDEGVAKRTAKSCGPDIPTLISSWRRLLRQSRRRRWQESPVTGESAKETVKTIAQGRPGATGEPVVTMLVWFLFFHARLRVRFKHPAFPAPSIFEGRDFGSPGRNSVAGRRRPVLLSCPASSGASSMPRLLGLSSALSGILDRPVRPGDDGGMSFAQAISSHCLGIFAACQGGSGRPRNRG
jgi:hypothetical protein